MKSYKDHYQVLGISPDSTREEVKIAFRKLSMVCHPDKNNNSVQSNRLYTVVLNAYKILSDDKKREEYDNFLKKSDFVRKFGGRGRTRLNEKMSCSNEEILEKINITLWEIDDLIRKGLNGSFERRILLIIITFLDRWILEPYGFPDYFMEVRRLERIDPREYITLLVEPPDRGTHLPYSSFEDYFFDIRKRADRFAAKYQAGFFPDGSLERIIEYGNMALYYLGCLFDNEKKIIPLYGFSNTMYNYPY